MFSNLTRRALVRALPLAGAVLALPAAALAAEPIGRRLSRLWIDGRQLSVDLEDLPQITEREETHDGRPMTIYLSEPVPGAEYLVIDGHGALRVTCLEAGEGAMLTHTQRHRFAFTTSASDGYSYMCSHMVTPLGRIIAA